MWEFRFAALAALSIAPFGATAQTGEWNTATGGNSGRTGFVSAMGPTEPSVLWEGSLSAVIAEQPVIDGDVVVSARMESMVNLLHGTQIVAHNIWTGEILWQRELPVDSAVADWRSRVMAISNGLVFATRAGDTNPGYLYALRLEDGSVAWRSADRIDESSIESPAFAGNGDLIVGNFNSLVRIRRSTGETVWSRSRGTPSSDSSAAALSATRAYIWEPSSTGPVVTAIDLATGARLYSSASLGAGVFQQVGLMVASDGTIYAPRTQNSPLTDAFVALQDTGTSLIEKWRVPMGYVPFASFGEGPDGSIYTYAPNRSVVRLDPQEGSVISRSVPIESDFHQPRMTIGADGTIYMTNGGAALGRLYSFNADLTERWRVEYPRSSLGGPALGSNGVLVVCGAGTDMTAYSTKTRLCSADWNNDGVIDSRDMADFLEAFFHGAGDYNHDGETGTWDFFDFLMVFVRGC